MKLLLIVSCLLSGALCGVVKPEENYEETTTLPPPPHPYAFGYAAGRFPGHIDRTHSEVSDGSGTVQGSYSYVDPRYQIRKVDYTADKYGFHPVLNLQAPDLPSDTPAVAAAKLRHLQKFAAIANSIHNAPETNNLPVDTKAVEFAKNKHFYLYQKIAEDHARIAAEIAKLHQEEDAETTTLNDLHHY